MVELSENLTAEQYQDPQVREYISQRYQEIHQRKVTPLTAPQQFDPLNPPEGWRWDPYYELWFQC